MWGGNTPTRGAGGRKYREAPFAKPQAAREFCMDHLLDHLHRIAHADAPHAGDAELLARFAARRDEVAFATLVRWHCPLVRGVCTRWLVVPHLVVAAGQVPFYSWCPRASRVETQ